MATPLENELRTYQKELHSLLDREGKFVLIQGDEVRSVWDSYEDAIQEGYNLFGLSKPFLVKRIEAVEFVHHITRDVCLS